MNVSNNELLKLMPKKGVRLLKLKHNARRQQRKLLQSNEESNSTSKQQERRGELQEKGGKKESKLKMRLQPKKQRHMNGNAKQKGVVDVAAAPVAVVMNHTHAQEED
jgi:hypothetical protein